MSKQRPSSERPPTKKPVGKQTEHKLSVKYWERRLIKPTFTRNGEIKAVAHWAIKLQHRGVRRTLSLATGSKKEAAIRALAVYKQVTSGSWEQVDAYLSQQAEWTTPQRIPQGPIQAGARTGSYWKPRLSQRSYLGEAGLSPSNQLCLRLDRDGVNEYFPTGTTQLKQATQFANQISSQISSDGWPKVLNTHSREFTVAIFWSVNPVATTYATMLTHVRPPAGPDGATSSNQSHHSPFSALVVEPKEEVRDTMAFWIDHNPSFANTETVDTVANAITRLPKTHFDLVIVNRQTQHVAYEQLLSQASTICPNTAVVSHGLYEDSNQIFRSVSGVDKGYALRRRSPDLIMEPAMNALPESSLSSQVATLIQQYFQNLFADISQSQKPSKLSLLTRRELEILEQLSAGFLDKEIADRLGISNWTVRNHLKRIYSKFGIHNRTEAVIQYLQK